MSAEERLRFYASQFPLTEIDSTYYAPPAEQQARRWAERTPEGFRFDVKAYSLLTGHPTRPRTLWAGPARAAPTRRGGQAQRVPEPPRPGGAGRGLAQVRERRSDRCTTPAGSGPSCSSTRRGSPRGARTGERSRRCASGCRTTWWPSSSARRCGWPRSAIASARWSCSTSTGWCTCASTPHRSQACRGSWRSRTRSCWSCASTGARTSTWKDTSRSAAERFRYLYSREELEELALPLAETARQARETHLLMNNCYRDYAVRNAAELRDLLAGYAA